MPNKEVQVALPFQLEVHCEARDRVEILMGPIAHASKPGRLRALLSDMRVSHPARLLACCRETYTLRLQVPKQKLSLPKTRTTTPNVETENPKMWVLQARGDFPLKPRCWSYGRSLRCCFRDPERAGDGCLIRTSKFDARAYSSRVWALALA